MLADMGLLDMLGITLERQPVEQFGLEEVVADATFLRSGGAAGDNSARAIPALFRGTQLLRDMSAQLTWAAWRGTKRSDQQTRRHPEKLIEQPAILVDPSPVMSRDDVIRTIVNNLIYRGWAPLYCQNLDPVTLRPRFATPVNPDEVHAEWNPQRTQVLYEWRGQRMTPGIDFAVIELQRPIGQPRGQGPIDATRDMLGGVVTANEYARDLFGDSATPAGTLKVPGKLTEPEAKRLRAQWEEQHQGGRGTAVLSGGMEYAAVSLTPEQAQFIASRGFGIQEVARLLGIPQHFLNAGQIQGSSQSLTYTNVQAVFRELTSVTLYPTYLRRIEAQFSTFLPRGVDAVFDLSDFMQADDGTRYGAWETAIRAGILDVSEVREREGLPPVTERNVI